MGEANRRRISNIKVGSILIIVFILIYIPSLYHWIYGININTDIVRNGLIEDSINTDGYIIRNEQVVISPFSGTFIPEIGDGEKIPVNYTIATVLNTSSEKLLKEYKNIELKILKAQKNKKENSNLFSSDAAKIDSEIFDKLKSIIKAGNSNRISDGKDIHDSIDALIQKKAIILGNKGTADNYIKSLINKKDNIKKSIDMNTGEINSADSGIVSFSTDGYENKLKPGDIESMTPRFLESIDAANMINTNDSRYVEAQKPLAKVIKDFDYNILVCLDQNKVRGFKTGISVDVRINEIGKTIEGRVAYISKSFDGKYIVSVRLDRYISQTAALRKTNVDLILNKKSYKGFKVPLSSIRDLSYKELTGKLVTVDSNYAKIKNIRIIGYDNEFAIIDNPLKSGKEGISLYDIYVTKPGNIAEGQIINQ